MTDPSKPTDLRVEFEESGPRGRFNLVDDVGASVGEMTFSRTSALLAHGDHVESPIAQN